MSCDSFLGIPFNIASYAALLQMAATYANLKVGVYTHQMGDCHLYCGEGKQGEWYAYNYDSIRKYLEDPYFSPVALLKQINSKCPDIPEDPKNNADHITAALEQMTREPYACPQLSVSIKGNTAKEVLENITPKDFQVTNYKYHPGISRKMPA